MKNTISDQLMGLRMNSVMNEITNSDMEYQEIIRKSDIYSDKLDALQLPKETRLLIDGYVSEQNALGSRYGMLAYQLGFISESFPSTGAVTSSGASGMAAGAFSSGVDSCSAAAFAAALAAAFSALVIFALAAGNTSGSTPGA